MSEFKTLRAKLYDTAYEALRLSVQEEVNALYGQCIKYCRIAAQKGDFETVVPSRVKEVLIENTKTAKVIVEELNNKLKSEADLEITNEELECTGSITYKIKFDTPN